VAHRRDVAQRLAVVAQCRFELAEPTVGIACAFLYVGLSVGICAIALPEAPFLR
jgi:hypothetical protein